MATKIGKGLRDILTTKPKKLALKAISDPKLGRRIKNRIILAIKKEGFLPSSKRVKGLASSTIERRRQLSTVNKTDRFFKDFFSNLTFSGQFLRSFNFKLFQKNKRVIFDMGPEGDHKPYKGIRGKKVGKLTPNSEIGKGLIKGGRDYTVISGENSKKIAKSVKAAILKEFKLNLKRK